MRVFTGCDLVVISNNIALLISGVPSEKGEYRISVQIVMGKDDNQREVIIHGKWGENKVEMSSWAGTPPLRSLDSQVIYDTLYRMAEDRFIALAINQGLSCFEDDKFVSQWKIHLSQLAMDFPHSDEC